ncbi:MULTISPECIES: hypothetical protein [Oerskovia]|uniref:Uncharacterized protein n=1 Tax=Oerskovia rustica TaxID=2762237 RepID=A0ABR8RWS7_9CELL|nr:hypothetical protein [Oerskovia rustica]MBD7952245.1 hypothetical protein [Oerskovia rustica]
MTSATCALVATVIPVFLLAGFLGQGLLRKSRTFRGSTRLLLLGYVAFSAGMTLVAAVGANDDGLSGVAAWLAWTALSLGVFAITLEAYIQIFEPSAEQR